MRPFSDRQIAAAMEALLLSDAMTANAEPSDGMFTVHEDNVEYLVETVLWAAFNGA